MSQTRDSAPGGGGATGPVNSFMALDYANLILKQGVEDALAEYRMTTVSPGATGPQSLAALAAAYPVNQRGPTGVSRTAQLARANQEVPLALGATVCLAGVRFVPPPGATLGAVASVFGVAATALASVGTNPQLSYLPLPSGTTAVAFAGPTGATTLSVSAGQTFQTIAAAQGITGPAIDAALLWPNLNVVAHLMQAGQPLAIPPFSRGITGPATLLSLASQYNLSVAQVASANLAAPIFGATATLSIPNPETLTVGHLLRSLKAAGFGGKVAGMAGRALLHGMRVPAPGAPTGPRAPLYSITQQQIAASGLTAGSELRLTCAGATAPSWLHFGASGSPGPSGATGPQVTYQIGDAGVAQISALAALAGYGPTGTFRSSRPYEVVSKHYALPHSVVWNLPAAALDGGLVPVAPTGPFFAGASGASGATASPALGSLFIRSFPSKLTAFLQAQSEGPVELAVKKQPVGAGAPAGTRDVVPCLWGCSLDVELSLLPKQERGKTEFVYAVRGTSRASRSLLDALLRSQDAIGDIYVLFPAKSAQAGQTQTTVALCSDAAPTAFLFRTNPAHGLQPPADFRAGIVQHLWESNELAHGGFYLYYCAEKGGQAEGLPAHLFGNGKAASLTLLVRCASTRVPSSTGQVEAVPRYTNCLVLDEQIPAADSMLYVEAVGPTASFDPGTQRKIANTHPGALAFSIARPNPNAGGATTALVSPEHQLDELYGLVEGQIAAQPGWNASKPMLPVGPRRPSPGLTAAPASEFHYDFSFPIAALAVPNPPPNGVTGPMPSPAGNPYAGVGSTLTVDFNLLDLFGNVLAGPTGGAWLSQTVVPGYTDALVGIGSWPHVSRSYKVTNDGELAIQLSFNPQYYWQQLAGSGVTAVGKIATHDRSVYEKVFYQLSQPDVAIMTSTTIDPSQSVDVKAPVVRFVADCWSTIGTVLQGLTGTNGPTGATAAPVSSSLRQPIADGNPADVFALGASLWFTRTGTVDPNFADLFEVTEIENRVPAQLSKAGAGTTGATGAGRLHDFAASFEAAFPSVKVAVGQASGGDADGGAKAVWGVRLATGLTGATGPSRGVYVALGDTPSYYAPRPIATSLVNRSRIPIYDVPAGQTYSEVQAQGVTGPHCSLKSYSGVNLSTLSRAFLADFDRLLLPDNAAAAAIASPSAFQSLLASKRALAGYLANDGAAHQWVVPVFESAAGASDGAAGRALRPALLAELSTLHTVESIVEVPVECRWNNEVHEGHRVELGGKFVTRGATTAKPAFAFSGSTLRVTAGATGSQLSAVFTTTSHTGKAATSSTSFADDVTFHVTSAGYGFGPGLVPGFEVGEWLSFVIPFALGVGPRGPSAAPLPLDIPLPLRAYPTAPALKTQCDVPFLPQYGQAAGATTTLHRATEWAYQFGYQYAGAAQDTISASVSFNVRGATGSHGGGGSNACDLASLLLQYRACAKGLSARLAHLPEFLADPLATTPSATFARNALVSFAELADQIQLAWQTWAEFQVGQSCQYEFEQREGADGQLLVDVRSLAGPTGIALPRIDLDGYQTHGSAATGATSATYWYSRLGATGPTGPSPLSFAARSDHPERTVSFAGLNILKEENAWAGLGVRRNADLGQGTTGPGQIVNPSFVYETPLVRAINVLNPYLDPAGTVYLGASGLLALADHLGNFFVELLSALPNQSALVKLAASYRFALNPDPALGLNTSLPMFLTTPYQYGLSAGNTPDAAFDGQVASRIEDWFAAKGIGADRRIGELVFDVTLFSTLSETQLPLLRLREVVLPCNTVVW